MSLVSLYAQMPVISGVMHTTPAYTSQLIDASAEKAACVFYAPKTGAIRKILWRTGTVTTGGTVDVRLETVSLTTGDPTGTLFGTTTNGSQVVADADDNVVFVTQLTADASVTKGDLLATVIVRDATAGNMNISIMAGDSIGFPYTDLFTSSWAKSLSSGVMALEYSDGSYAFIENMWPMKAVNAVAFSSSSTPDERGNIWTPPVKCRVTGAWVLADLNGDAEIVLYGPDGVTPMVTALSVDTNVRAQAAARISRCSFVSTATLAAGSAYRLVLRPGATNVTLPDFDVQSAAAMDAFQCGQAMHYTSAKNPAGTGDWTQVTTKRACMGFRIDQFDDGASVGGGSIFGGVVR